MKKKLLIPCLLLSLCVSCAQSNEVVPPSPEVFSSETEDLGDGYSLVTDYDEQGRVVRETTYYSGEFYPDGQMYSIDPETGALISMGTPEIVENMVMGYLLYDYNGEGYYMQVRQYSIEAPEPDIPYSVLWEDEAGRTLLYEAHRNFHWGITQDYYQYTFAYGEPNAPVEVTVFTSFVQNTLPGTKPVTDSAQYTLTLGSDAYAFLPAPASYGTEGILGFTLYELDEQGEYLRVCSYDRDGTLTDQFDWTQAQSSGETGIPQESDGT